LNFVNGIIWWRIGALKLMVLGGFAHISVSGAAEMVKPLDRLADGGTGASEFVKWYLADMMVKMILVGR
jgi:hypothetical protein